MKAILPHQEILLFSGAAFFSRELQSREPIPENPGNDSPMDQMVRACWAGLLTDLLPELAAPFGCSSHMFIWYTIPGLFVLYVNQGVSPDRVDMATSLDPYSILCTTFYN